MAKFQPASEEEAANVFSKGLYAFEVMEAEETERSKTGAPMFKVKLNVFHNKNDSTQHVYDYLGTDFMEFKLRHFCYSVGLGDGYESGEVHDTQMVGRSGKVTLKVETDDYGTKNVVVDYDVAASATKRSQDAKRSEKVKPQGVNTAQQMRAADAKVDPNEVPF